MSTSFFRCLKAPPIQDEWRTSLKEIDFEVATRDAKFEAMRRFFWVDWGLLGHTPLAMVVGTFTTLLVVVWAAVTLPTFPSAVSLVLLWLGNLVCYEVFFGTISSLYRRYHDGLRALILAEKARTARLM